MSAVWNLDAFSRMLQMSMLPVVMISAAALLLLSVTNRLGRTIDRSREIARELAEGASPAAEAGRDQLRVLVRRAGLLRACASLIALSILFSALMMLGLLLHLFAGWAAQTAVIAGLFLSVLSLVGSLAFFLADVSAALKALRLDVARYVD